MTGPSDSTYPSRMAKSKYNTLPLPGNSSGTQNFNEEQDWTSPDDSKNGNLDNDGKPSGQDPSPFANLKGGR